MLSVIVGEIMYRFVKRWMDLFVALAGIILLAPLLLIVIMLIWIRIGKPILFRQMRPGLNSKPFNMYKFRTMSDERNESGDLLSDELRMTKLGKMLRSTSLDELPELFNVLKGDMSLVGPRPLLMKYLDRYTPEQARRHKVKPGITGWAQVNGRNAISWEEKFAFDIWYVDNCSLWLDVKILFMTAFKVFKREGISAEGETTMPEFMGSTISTKPMDGTAAENEAAACQD